MCNAIAAAGNSAVVVNGIARADVLAAAGGYTCVVKFNGGVVSNGVIAVYTAVTYNGSFKRVGDNINIILVQGVNIHIACNSPLTAHINSGIAFNIVGALCRVRAGIDCRTAVTVYIISYIGFAVGVYG